MMAQAGCAPTGRAARRRARTYRLRWLTLLAFCATSIVSSPQGIADPHPLVPPLPGFHNNCVCPSRAAACIGLPFIPVCEPECMGAPAGEPWHLTIQEAVNIALSNSEAVRNLGLVEAASRNDVVRSIITTYDPLIARSEAQAQWGIFDPLWTTNMQWNKQDIPPGTSFSGIGNRPPQLDTADFDTTIEQLLPVGTRVHAQLVTDYLFNPDHPVGLDPNPQYFSYTQFGLTQPLLQGLGVNVTMAPIKIACAEAERTDWQFKQEMLALVRSIETTYWALYAEQQNLRAIDEILPHFREVVRLRQEQAETVGTPSEVARAQSELYLFEQRRLDTLSKIAEQQLVLRNLMGVPPSDCRDIKLLAVPVTTKPFETLCNAVQTAVSQRPDVLRQRLAVYVAQQQRLLADNAVKPRLDFNGYWRTNGLGETLDESWDVKADNDFNDWQLGVFFQVPIGRRQARAELRAAEYRISRERAMLEQTAHQASYEVTDAYRRIHWVYQQLEVARNRGQALSQWNEGAKAQFDNPPPGMSTVFALELYLQNLRDVTDASLTANALLAEYNSALARLEEVKGTLLENRMVTVAGDTTSELPTDLPTPYIQLPESVKPAPLAPTPAEPAPVEPAPMPAPHAAPPAEPQGAQQLPQAAPQISQPVEIAQQPPPAPFGSEPQDRSLQPLPLPEMAMPESVLPEFIQPDLAAPMPEVIVQTPPEVSLPPLATPPMELAQEMPLEPLPVEGGLPLPAIELPESIMPSEPLPARTAMQPTPAETPIPVESPMVEALPEPLPMDAIPEPAEIFVQPLPPATLAMPESVRPAPMHSAATPRPTASPRMEPAPAAAPEVARRAPRHPFGHDPQQAIRMPESVNPAPSRLVTSRNPAPLPAVEAGPATLAPVEIARRLPEPGPQQLPPVSLQLPQSIQPTPLPAPDFREIEPQPWYGNEAASAGASGSTSAVRMQLPDSIRADAPQVTLTTIPAAESLETLVLNQPPTVFQQPVLYVPRPLPAAQATSTAPLQMPASIMVGRAPVTAAPTRTADQRGIRNPASVRAPAARPISYQVAAPALQMPPSVGSTAR